MRGRMVAVAVATAVVVVGTANPAGAAPRDVLLNAVAFWDVGDASNTAVSVQATERKGRDDVFLFVTQSFCDTAANEQVFRSFGSGGTIPEPAFTVSGNVRRARLAADVVLSGSETRLSGCDGLGEVVSTGPLPASTWGITASWAATGPLLEVQPGIERAEATATGVLSPVGDLGVADFASLERFSPQG